MEERGGKRRDEGVADLLLGLFAGWNPTRHLPTDHSVDLPLHEILSWVRLSLTPRRACCRHATSVDTTAARPYWPNVGTGFQKGDAD